MKFNKINNAKFLFFIFMFINDYYYNKFLDQFLPRDRFIGAWFAQNFFALPESQAGINISKW